VLFVITTVLPLSVILWLTVIGLDKFFLKITYVICFYGSMTKNYLQFYLLHAS